MVLNTTNGPVEVPRGTREPVVNTSSVLEPPAMQYLDEPPEILAVLNAGGYVAVFEDGHHEPLLFWIVNDEGEVYGTTLSDGRANLTSVEDREGYVRYEKMNTDTKEN